MRIRIAPLLGYLILALGTLYAVAETSKTANEAKDAVEQSRQTSKRSRDQVCRVFEGQHLREVESLRNTYVYLDRVVARHETGDTLNQFIIRGLPATEVKARSDPAPAFCDKPNVGLPEPDPVLPKKRDFSRYIQ